MYYLEKLQNDFKQKNMSNKSYSLKAYARDLQMAHSTLCLVLKGKKEIPKKNIDFIVKKLCKNHIEETKFRESLAKNKYLLDNIQVRGHKIKRKTIDDSGINAEVISKWKYYGLLTLISFNDFNISDLNKVSEKLGLSLEEVLLTIKVLEEAKLIEVSDFGDLKNTNYSINTIDNIPSKALVDSHLETLDLGKEKLQNIPLDYRYFTSVMFPTNLNKISEAKTIIGEFREKMEALLTQGNTTDVFQLAIQLYPMTNIEEIKNE